MTFLFFFFNDTATTEIYTLSLHDALPISFSANNYMLRYRVAQALGPIVKYKSGLKAGQLVAPDIEAWFQQDSAGGQPHIVAQWADAHNAAAQGWVSADPSHAKFIADWATAHKAELA